MLKIKGMSIIITGGCSGLGLGMAKKYSKAGARITICGRREEKVKKAQKELGSNVLSIVADVTKDSDREKIIDSALQHGNKIDVLINNSGNMYRGQIEDLEEQKLLDIFNTNVISGMMLLGKAKKYLAET